MERVHSETVFVFFVANGTPLSREAMWPSRMVKSFTALHSTTSHHSCLCQHHQYRHQSKRKQCWKQKKRTTHAHTEPHLSLIRRRRQVTGKKKPWMATCRPVTTAPHFMALWSAPREWEGKNGSSSWARKISEVGLKWKKIYKRKHIRRWNIVWNKGGTKH